ncbi:NUMOD1 domain-containing DNA-binding protein [Winogradskyella sediminis]|uniref:Group I intron endonuclease n=1 Tax=Winogradskyella sediminis TaxID=1382466 RepID=A0A1H1SN99_9FLAO|nr:NUMOD1 domain-containing DNA-binding protein [Winogradskyella sediminis]SDS49206.1 group I intron endonuclease [Winogradskyella sediminis]
MEKENNYIIYKAENEINGWVYIGATSNSVHQRKLDHLERANRQEKGKFYEAISTYGKDVFNWEQVDTASTVDELAEKEKSYILEYNSQENGYNSDSGGGLKKTVYQYNISDGSLVNSYDSLQSAANAVSASKTSIGNTCIGQNKTCKGYHWSYNLSEPFRLDKDLRKKEVIQFTYSGKQIAVYESVAEASRQTGVSKSCISRVCRGERSRSGGFVWKYN